MLGGEVRLRLGNDVTFQWLADSGQAVLVSLTSGQLYTCNQTTYSFLSAIDGERTFDQIVDGLAGQYEVAREKLRADLSAMADELIRQRLVFVTKEIEVDNP